MDRAVRQHGTHERIAITSWPLKRGARTEPSSMSGQKYWNLVHSLQLLDDGREGEIMPEGYLPFDYNLWRIMGHDID